jgi:putative transposase
VIYHVLNRGNAGIKLFRKDADYEIFETALEQAVALTGTRLLGYVLMQDHWHLVLWPRRDGELSEFMRWLTVTHTRRWHAAARTSGSGHLYQGRFKSFPIQPDAQSLVPVIRFVESNPVRSGLTRRAEDWRHGSLFRRERGEERDQSLLARWPVPFPAGWLRTVNARQDERELAAVRLSVVRGSPFGADPWRQRTARKLGLESTMRPRGRPRKYPRPPEQEPDGKKSKGRKAEGGKGRKA